MSKRIDITGNRYGRLTVTGYHSTNDKGKALWSCVCDCGEGYIAIGENLKAGKVTSCGCYRKEIAPIISATHGQSKTRLYSIWQDMRRRCSNPRNKEYKNYGGRGITVCQEWDEYMTFHTWAMNNGYSDELTIDRKDVNGRYEPSNCKWSTWSQQGQNKRLSTKNTTGMSGVTFKKDRDLYIVRIGVNGQRKFIGEFKTIEEAKQARIAAEQQYWG